LEPVFTQLELDPFAAGAQLIDATDLAALRADEAVGKLIPTVPLLVAQVCNRHLASAVKLALAECYPDAWQVKLVQVAAVVGAGKETVIEMPLYELDRNMYTNHLTMLYVPPVDELTALRLPETLRYIIWRLRRDPDGCPWDRQQTHQSLMRYVIEETYEVVEALEENDMEKLAEELGDLLLQVYLHAEIARQEEEFAIGDVYEHINSKMLRRHPHVFSTVKVDNAGQVVQNWEMIKQQERANAGKDGQEESVLKGVPQAAPALNIAQEYQKRAAKTGFEFTDIQGAYAKLAEELQELQQATTPEERREELGDVLFIAAKLATFLKMDAEEALRRANRKFRQRFQYMEEQARQQGRSLTSYSDQEWEELWAQAKVHSQAS
ncbi:MAG TPA: nucleoside triphosphate pyrophosphohydrolase, partial [Ktedonobacteraceae bacterium]|nr:nucleoside triphosphate pyrophosphohydrolase [Ktedonobacteraceae bacterium]